MAIEQAFSWVPYKFLLEWSEKPNDVPKWDVTRGIEPARYYLSQNQGHLQTESFRELRKTQSQPFALIVESQRHFEEKCSEHRRYHAYPPPYEPMGEDYPRLTTHRLGPFLYAFSKSKPPNGLLEALRNSTPKLKNLNRGKNYEKLKRHVLNLANTYAQLENSDCWLSNYSNSLEDWKFWIKNSRFHWELANTLRLELEMGIAFDFEATLDNVRLILADAPYLQMSRSDDGMETLEGFIARMGVSGVFRSQEQALETIADIYLGLFEARAEFRINGSKFELRSGAGVYLFYELWLLYRNAKSLRVCKGCRTPFLARRQNQEYCNPGDKRCANRFKRMQSG
jgi:hypothetical protein